MPFGDTVRTSSKKPKIQTKHKQILGVALQNMTRTLQYQVLSFMFAVFQISLFFFNSISNEAFGPMATLAAPEVPGISGSNLAGFLPCENDRKHTW